MFWVDFLGLGEQDSKRSYAMRFQGAANVLDVTSRTDYLPKGDPAWLAKDVRNFIHFQAGVDNWSLQSARALPAVTPAIEKTAVANEMLQKRSCQGEVDASGRLIFRAPQGSHRLHCEPLMPSGMQGDLSYSLWLDDKPTGLLLEQGASVLWSDDDQALVCRARVESQAVEETATWLWQAVSGWRPLDEPWQSLVDEPALEYGVADRLDAGRLIYDALLRERVTEQPLADVRALSLRIQLDGTEAPALQLLPMQGGEQPCLSMLRKSLDGRRHVFACHIGAWQLPGQWCLDHRVSTCGRYLALIAFVEAPAVPHQLVVADVLARRLLTLDEPLLIAGLAAFDDGVINLLRITGRLAGATEGGALPRLEALAPAADQAERFVVAGRLHYQSVKVSVDAWSLRLLPSWRLEWRPVPACTQGDYLLPAPGGRDAAWLFGLSGAADEGPGSGYVLTASGCGVANLAPSMAWSADGRYLALSRKLVEEDAGTHSPQWFLLLLDNRERTLRQSSQPLGQMPCFEAFDDAGLHVSSAAQEPQLIDMQALLALPRQMLIRSGDVWLPSEQLSDAVHWQRLDKDHLQSWRVPETADSLA
ncbi:hypothetical protein [Pseudomonas sp.]|uniref:hypothetical protein n=1 Tax=Pseudomonas sp. TaxID=306 RepID=UPI003D11561B